jgi:phosphoglycolate phosphatase
VLAVPYVVLWDIDKTLVDIGDISREIYADAFARVTNMALREVPDMAGRTDHDLILATLKVHGVSDPDGLVEPFYDALTAATAARYDEIRQHGRRLPGAKEALELLDSKGTVQTVVTGNIRAVAEIKLRAFDLDDAIDFEIGGYGSDDGARATLVRLARARVAAKHGASAGQDIVVIGDTPHDIAGAKFVARGFSAARCARPGRNRALEVEITSGEDVDARVHAHPQRTARQRLDAAARTSGSPPGFPHRTRVGRTADHATRSLQDRWQRRRYRSGRSRRGDSNP